MQNDGLSRRHFFLGPLLAGAVPVAGFGSVASLKQLGYRSPNEKLDIASIGAGGKAATDIAACALTENIVALCDVDATRAEKMFQKFESAPKYKDYRQMLDKEDKNIDAVIVSIPDHMHAAAALAAMERGKHVYVQKPLAHTVAECRALRAAAHKYKVATQMGNQGYSNEGTRQCAEMIWAGEIGKVTEVHAWTNRPIWPQGLQELPKESSAPDTLDWNLWLGIAGTRPYSEAYAPFKWRGFYDFGCGALGDMACHILGAPNVALRLGPPTSVECLKQEGKSKFYYPSKSVIRFEFPARGAMPPVRLTWYDGMKAQPEILGVPAGERLGDLPGPRKAQQGQSAEEADQGRIQGKIFTDAYFAKGAADAAAPARQRRAKGGDANANLDAQVARAAGQGSNGSLFVGDKGLITTGTYGECTRLLPMEKMRDYKFPAQFLSRSPGHYRDWIRSCKGGEPSCSNFDNAAPFTEWILLGVLALRFDGKLEWDAQSMRITNNSDANKLLQPMVREGWKLPL